MGNVDLHGVEFKDRTEAGGSVSLVAPGSIALFATAAKGEIGKWIEVNSLTEGEAIFGKAKEGGAVANADNSAPNAMTGFLEAIYAQVKCIVHCYRVEGKVEADHIGNVASCPKPPGVIIAPGFDAAVASKISTYAASIGAIAVADSDKKDPEAAKAFAASRNGDRNLYLAFSELNFGSGFIPASAAVAGLIKRVEAERGPSVTPSNQKVFGVLDIRKYVSWSISDRDSEANKLNIANVSPFVQTDEGLRLWGNRLSDGSFVSTLKIKNLVKESIRKNILWAVDEGIDAAYVSLVTRRVNNFLKDLTSDGAILGGRCFVDQAKNSVAKIKDGKVTFDYEFTEKLPAEHVTFIGKITYDGYKNIFEQGEGEAV